ncbi:Squalene monooxygenase [Hibiscus syriacus]|uniref:squalene monooxygenase n=1 Tax=Hibiscus syriacus TaxID=106335 RepID=A0A6A3CRX9_HIBSY|nr:Squalene monooxygenase [Hibiscus syriacus]
MQDGLRVHVIERDLTEPDRIVGEFLQPGGYLKLMELGLENRVEEIDAQQGLPQWTFHSEDAGEISFPSQVDVPSYFVGLVLENCHLPYSNYGHVIVADPSPIVFYPISGTEVRCLVDVPGQRVPSIESGEMAIYLKTVVAPQVPPEFYDSFVAAVDKGNIRTMLNRSMPASPHPKSGALLMGDAFNMRHPLTGGGMTVALSDIPVASTINTLAGALYRVFCASPDQARKEMRQACFDYLSLGGVFSTGPISLLSGLNPRPLSLVLHFFAVAIYGVGRLLLPFPSPKRIWIGARLISGESGIIFPIIKAGARQMFFPAMVPAYYRAPPLEIWKARRLQAVVVFNLDIPAFLGLIFTCQDGSLGVFTCRLMGMLGVFKQLDCEISRRLLHATRNANVDLSASSPVVWRESLHYSLNRGREISASSSSEIRSACICILCGRSGHHICRDQGEDRKKIRAKVDGLRYRFMVCPNPVRSMNSFVAMLESANEVGGTSGAAEYDAENRWEEILEDSSEDEEIEEPLLAEDDAMFHGDEADINIDEYSTSYQPTPHMQEIDYEAMRAPKFPEMPHLTSGYMIELSDNSGELAVGKQYRGKKEATLAIKEYCIRGHVDCKTAESNQKTLYAKCVKYGPECKWLIRVSKMQRQDAWVITRIPCSVLAASIRDQFGYNVKYKPVWHAKEKARRLIYGDWDTSYNELPDLLRAIKQFIPGTIVKSQTMPAYDREDQLVQGKRIFHRLFWAFKSCIEGFPFCKRMVQIDGTWLYGQYRHILLIAVAQDGQRNIFPIAFAIVEGETTEAWDFFLNNLRKYVVREEGVSLISDRGTGLLAAIERPGSRWTPPHAYPAYCIRHIGKNYIEKFHNGRIRREIVSMGYELRQPNFDKRLEDLKAIDERVWKWASKIEREKWSQAYDCGRRYEHMTTNLAEAINSVLKGTRHLPIASVVKETYFRLAKVWSDKGKEIECLINRGKIWAPAVVEAMEANERMATSMFVHDFD